MAEIVQQCLDAHNEYRRKHGASPLVISQSLMGMAQNWAQTNANSCQMYHSSNRGDVGENLYAGTARLTDGRIPVDSWYNEIEDYYWNRPGTGSGVIGHFTQVVWKSCTELGVGWAKGSDGWTYFCCNYAPAGNYRGDYEGNVLPLGTACDEPEESNEAEPEDEEEEQEPEEEEEETEEPPVEDEEEEEPEEEDPPAEEEETEEPPAEEEEAEEPPAEEDEEEQEAAEDEEQEAEEQEEEEQEEDEGEIEEVPLGQVDLDEDYNWERREED
uniref:SCP domain-containing protein n=1 Tax=Daphnia galeata TaxID=27404 RepID=A0A8J2WM01_9CRUS|nr:unnamed protein product [Daphnia galeata]